MTRPTLPRMEAIFGTDPAVLVGMINYTQAVEGSIKLGMRACDIGSARIDYALVVGASLAEVAQRDAAKGNVDAANVVKMLETQRRLLVAVRMFMEEFRASTEASSAAEREASK